MAKILLAHARTNEIGQISGGKAGDQTGSEVCVQPYFDDAWEYILRPFDYEMANKIAADAGILAGNDNIGYDQPDRYSMYTQAKLNNWNFASISKPCHTDCSQMAATLAIANGVEVSPFLYSGNIVEGFVNSGKFEKLPFNKNDLHRGDILVTVTKRHVAIVMESDNKEPSFCHTPYAVGEAYGKEIVTVYAMPDGSAKALKAWPALAAGNLFDICDEYEDWFYIRIAGKHFGWLQKSFVLLKTATRKAKITTQAYLRTNPGSKFASLAVMPKNATVDVCDEKPTSTGAMWSYVIYRGIYGFCSGKYVK